MKKVKSLIISLLIFLNACAGSLNYIPDGKSVEAEAYTYRCGICHSVPHPKRYTKEQWQNVVSLMNDLMEERDVDPMDREEKELILSYLRKYAR